MRRYRVEFTTAAARQIRKLDPVVRRRIVSAVEKLESDPRPPSSTSLVGEPNVWRIRVGDYRVIYEIFDEQLTVTIVRAGHRREPEGVRNSSTRILPG